MSFYQYIINNDSNSTSDTIKELHTILQDKLSKIH